MELQFTKMHGCGNDYIYINTFQQTVPDFSTLAKKLSDRRFGIGGDGVIYICPSDRADACMRMFNEDGSEGKMCGNGIRCVAKYLYDQHLAHRNMLRIETLAGIKEVNLQIQGGEVVGATVDMGQAILTPSQVPVLLEGDAVIRRKVWFGENEYAITCVSMGNPHCVILVPDPDDVDLAAIGPTVEHAPIFPERVNTEFISVCDRHHLRMRVWERGSGETLACGTGACAAVAAAVVNGYCPKNEPITVSLRGGELQITYTDASVLLSGPAKTVFTGFCDPDRL